MATTAGTTLPMAPVGGTGAAGVRVKNFPATDGTIREGDIVILTSGKLVEDNSSPVANTIVGVALADSTAADEMIPVALALPGAEFEINLMDGNTDEVGVYATDVGVVYGIAENTQGHACFDEDVVGITTKCLLSLRFAKQRNSTQDADPLTAGVGITNPRMVVCFVASAFNQNIDQA